MKTWRSLYPKKLRILVPVFRTKTKTRIGRLLHWHIISAFSAPTHCVLSSDHSASLCDSPTPSYCHFGSKWKYFSSTKQRVTSPSELLETSTVVKMPHTLLTTAKEFEWLPARPSSYARRAHFQRKLRRTKSCHFYVQFSRDCVYRLYIQVTQTGSLSDSTVVLSM